MGVCSSVMSPTVTVSSPPASGGGGFDGVAFARASSPMNTTSSCAVGCCFFCGFFFIPFGMVSAPPCAS